MGLFFPEFCSAGYPEYTRFVDLHALVVLIVTIFGGTLEGLGGLSFAVPIATATIESSGHPQRHGHFDDEPEATPNLEPDSQLPGGRVVSN